MKPKPVVVAVTCDWTLEHAHGEWWDTACGRAFQVEAGTPAENGMRFCCYCGGLLIELEAK